MDVEKSLSDGNHDLQTGVAFEGPGAVMCVPSVKDQCILLITFSEKKKKKLIASCFWTVAFPLS